MSIHSEEVIEALADGMTPDDLVDLLVLAILRVNRGTFLTLQQILDQAFLGSSFDGDEEWAKPSCEQLVTEGFVEKDNQGRYRVR